MDMTVMVEDFGPIGEGSVELRPLTVFVGPSNTGKSYLAILLYALHRHFRSAMWERLRRPFREDDLVKSRRIPELTDALEAMLRGAKPPVTREPVTGENAHTSLPRPIAAWIRDALIDDGPFLCEEIERCFGAERGDLVRHGRSMARIGLRRCAASSSVASDGVIEHELAISNEDLELTVSVPEGMALVLPLDFWRYRRWAMRDEILLVNEPDDELTWWQLREALAFVGDRVLDDTLGPIRLPAFYLPADRTGIMHAHRVVVGTLIENATMAGLRRTEPTPTLSGVLADFLQHLIKMDPRDRRLFHPELGKSIEDRILHGSVKAERDETDYPSFRYRPRDWATDLPLMRASSMVAELAPLVLYLRHVVATDNVLIVEEPESHLHPGMQVELVRQLAKLVEAGVRVLVTTHSEWVLDELANIVRLSELPEKGRRGISSSETALAAGQVGAWLFEPRGSEEGSVIKEVPLDETGYARTGFEEVAMALHNRFATISDRIEEAR